MTTCHIQSAPSCLWLFLSFSGTRRSSNQQLQAVLVVGLLGGAGGQEGCGYRCSSRRGDVQEGVGADAGGRRVTERRGCCDAGKVDAKREPRLLQGFFRHGERLQLLLTVGHVRVLTTTTDTVQACLKRRTTRGEETLPRMHCNSVTEGFRNR